MCDENDEWELNSALLETMFGITTDKMDKKSGPAPDVKGDLAFIESVYERIDRAIIDGYDSVREYLSHEPKFFCASSLQDLLDCNNSSLAYVRSPNLELVVCPSIWAVGITDLLPRGKVQEGTVLSGPGITSLGSILLHEL